MRIACWHDSWRKGTLPVRLHRRLILVLLLILLIVPLGVISAAGKPVKITDPSAGQTVSGTYPVRGTGANNKTVQIQIDGGAWQPVTGSSSWSYAWDTTPLADGPHTLTARYSDGSSTFSVNVTVDNIPDTRPPNPGEVLINEFVAAPQTTQTSEWVELYNTTSVTLNIGGMYFDDIAGGGGTPQQIPAGATIAPAGFYTFDSTVALNNTGDDVRLLGSDQATVHDSYTYTSPAYDMSWCRKPDGGGWAGLQCDPTRNATNGTGGSTWTPGSLEIYVLNVGQGESQLIIGPTGRSVLIGVYESNWNTNQGAQYVAAEIRRITGGSHVNYIMPSHWHLDHMGYAGYGGIWSLLEQQGITTDAIIDRNGGEWVDSNTDGICDPDLEIQWTNAGTVSGTARNWLCWVDNPLTIGGQKRQLAQLGSTTQIDLGIGSGVTVKIVQVDADGALRLDGTPVQGDHTAEAVPPSENDYSITVWVHWNKFDFVAGGDTDGEYATSEFSYTYNDVETIVAQRINQEVEAIWVNHHGSSHSTNQNYVDTLSPAVAAFSCGSTNTYGHPGQNVLDRLNLAGTAMYFTQPCDPTRNYYSARFINGNVEIKTADGVAYTVNGDAYTATDPAPPSGPRPPAVGEVVINEVLPAPSVTFTVEWVELYNSTGVTLDIGGMWLDDIAGGGGTARQIPAGTTIAPGGYFTMDFTSYFNNTGDDVRLLSPDQAVVHDAKTYGSSQSDKSWCRVPNGGAWSATMCIATKGAAN